MKEIRELLNLVSNKKATLLNIYNKFETELKTNPASVKYHHCEKGGFYRHLKEVMNIALDTYNTRPDWYDCTVDDVIIVSFVHDFNKLGRYVDSEDWKKQPKYGSQYFEYNKNKLSLIESADTVRVCAELGLVLSEKQANAVCYHHGGWSEGARVNLGDLTPLAVLIHFADLMSAKVYATV